MAHGRRSSRSGRRSQAASSKIRRETTKLRKAGLTKATPGKKSRPGGSAYARLKKFSDVLSGKAAVIKAPKEIVEKYKTTFKIVGNKIVVPTPSGEKVSLSHKTKTIHKTRTYVKGGRKYGIIVPTKIQGLTDLPRGNNIRYIVYVGKSRINMNSYRQLINYLEEDYRAIFKHGFEYKIDRIEILQGPKLGDDNEYKAA